MCRAGSFSSHGLVVGVVGFLVRAVFLFTLGWGKRLFCLWAMLDGWDREGALDFFYILFWSS